MSRANRVLFVGHHASRTGAPLLLLHFLRWLAENSSIEFEILLTHGGELAPDYASVARTRVLGGSQAPAHLTRLMRRVGRKLRLTPSTLRVARQYPADRFPLVYSNTVANGDLVGVFGRQGHRVVCHAHEMKFAIEQWGGASARRTSVYLDSVIAASNAVKRDIVGAWHLPEDRIEVIHEFGQPLHLDPARQAAARQEIRRTLGVGETDILVAMCGTMDWRKGGDVFLQLARHLKNGPATPRHHLVWIGAPTSRTEQVQLAHDLEMLGVGPVVTIAGQVPNPQDYMSACDVFTLTSREDPCPLAMIEAAALGRPVICFAGSGGATDFVGDDAGMIVPYLDVAAMASAVTRLGRNPELREQLGGTARRRTVAGYSLESQAPKLLAILERQLAAAGAAVSNP